MTLTYHLVLQNYWEAQNSQSEYRPEPMQAGREDFIHCTDGAANMAATANRYYRATPGQFILLVIDLDKVKAPVKYEDAGHIYPHIYGPLNRDAIVNIIPMPRAEDGQEFLPPEK